MFLLGKGNVKFITYLYVFFIAVLSYGISFFTAQYFTQYFFFEWQLVSSKFLVVSIHLINLIFVATIWWFFNKWLQYIDLKPLSGFNIVSLYLLPVVITIIFQIYQGKIGNTTYFALKDLSTYWPLVMSTVIIVPIIEELIYRELLVRFLYKNNHISTVGIIYISFLFTLTHIDSIDINWLYLIYIFIIGVAFLLIRVKKGLLGSIIAHSLINVIVLLFQLNIW